MMKIKLSIIIVTYNSYDLILDCINSVFHYNDIETDELEIIVVDNSSVSEGERLKKLLFEKFADKITFIKNNNKGYGHGNNIGIKHSNGGIIAIMNPDIRLKEPIFKKVLETFKDDHVASLGFKQINGAGDFSFYRFPELFFPFLYSIKNRNDNNSERFDQHKHSLSGAFVFFRKKDFEKIGFYDESFFMYFEEPDVAKRITQLDKKVIYDNSKSYIHLMEQKESFNLKLLDIGSDSLKKYFVKHHLNLKTYLDLRIIELKLYKIIFMFLRNKDRVNKADAYLKSLRKIRK
jgi:GT2 family glycosyltransferase